MWTLGSLGFGLGKIWLGHRAGAGATAGWLIHMWIGMRICSLRMADPKVVQWTPPAGATATNRLADPKEDARGREPKDDACRQEPKEDGMRMENLRTHARMQWMHAHWMQSLLSCGHAASSTTSWST